MSSTLVWNFFLISFAILPPAFATDGHVYNFSFAKSSAPKPKAQTKKPMQVKIKPAQEALPVVSQPGPAAAVETPVTSSDPAASTVVTPIISSPNLTQTVQTKIEALRENYKPWTLSLSGAQVADRNGRRAVPALGLETQLVGDLIGEAQIWNTSGVDGSVGASYRKQLPNSWQSISLGALAGVMSTPEQAAPTEDQSTTRSLRVYYGAEGLFFLTPRLSLSGQIRLQDNTRFGLANFGIGYRL
ncbi:MAG: hypothetical protein ACXVA9_13045 [Bdellovibrionales bacterium]